MDQELEFNVLRNRIPTQIVKQKKKLRCELEIFIHGIKITVEKFC
jgi:hypothetical protein